MIALNTTPKIIARSQTFFDPSSAQPIYIGRASEGLLTSQDGWLIYKFTYSGTDITTIQTAIGIYDNRSGLVYS